MINISNTINKLNFKTIRDNPIGLYSSHNENFALPKVKISQYEPDHT